MTTETFTTAGAGNWVCPAGVTSVQIECQGGAGAGTRRTLGGGAAGGGGGGGGAYAKINAFTSVPGNSYAYVVGAGGVSSTGADGGDTTFNVTTCVAKGGVTEAVDTQTAGTGGLASGSTGDVTRNGGNGAAGVTTVAGGGGGGAGSTTAGGNASGTTAGAAGTGSPAGGIGGAGRSTVGAGLAGAAPGGGGGGGRSDGSGNNSGAAGQAGQITLTYTAAASTRRIFIIT